MSLSPTDLRDVGILITCALRPKLRPATDPAYRSLLERFRTEPEFRDGTRSVLDGMDLLVLSDGADLGLIIGPRRESVFAYRLGDIPNATSVENRLLVGLVTAAVAAYAFPTPASFDDERVHYVNVKQLERFVRETCEAFKQDAGPAFDDESLEEAWRIYERMPVLRKPNQGRTAGRLSSSCSTYWVGAVLEWLVSQGLARPAAGQAAGTYQLLERFRVQVREMSGHEAYRALSLARAGDSGPDATIPPEPGPDDENFIPADVFAGDATEESA